MSSDEVYKRRTELVLVLLSNLYFDNEISIGDSRSSSYPIYTSYFYYYLKEFYMILS